MDIKKIVVIGAGHNGLVAAAYLAKAGHDVTVIESRHVVGGAASTDTTTFPGYKISTASYLNSLFLPEIIHDLALEHFGYEMLPRNPSSFTPLPDSKKSLLMGSDMEYNQMQIEQFSAHDAVMYPRYEEELGEIADWVAKMMTMTPPNIPPRNMRDVENILKMARHGLRLNPKQMLRMKKLFLSSPIDYLNKWFESDVLKATLLTDALIGATEMSGYVLLHHVMGVAGGSRGVWGYMRGGMGGISNALAAACREFGATILLDTEARRIVVNNNRALGVLVLNRKPVNNQIPSWKYIFADIVVSAVDPTVTFAKLLKSVGSVNDIRKQIVTRDTKSASMKINLTLSGLPDFRAKQGMVPGPQHRGTIHIAPSVAYIVDALNDLKKGCPSTRPVLELTIPSVVDNTLAPPGCHVMNIFLQFVPYTHPYGDWNTEKNIYFSDIVLPLLREYIANIDEIIQGIQILTPQDIESEFGMSGGNIFSGGMGLSQLFFRRPIRGMADYRTPIQGLYLSGAGTHPGGGVTGASGSNAAREVLCDIDS